MYSHQIDAMIQRLISDHVIQPDQAEAAKKSLTAEWTDKIAIVWDIGDVQSMRAISDEHAREVLQKVLHKFSAEVGINWDVLQAHVQDYPIDAAIAQGQ